MNKIYSLNHQPGRWMFWDGQAWLYFSGTSYLGIANNELFQDILAKSMIQYGSNFGSSRLGLMRLSIYEEAEELLSKYLNQEAVLTFSSGTLAGILANRVFTTLGELYFAPNAHPALWLQMPTAFKNRNEWEQACMDASNQSGPPLFMYSNAIDSLCVIPYDFSWLQKLGDKRELILVLDESHTLGIWGKDGAGLLSSLKLPNHVQGVVVASMGKGLGVPAGVIAGNKFWIDKIWNSPHFGGASPASPAYLDTWVQFQDHYHSLRQILNDNISTFEKRMEGRNSMIRSISGYPVHFSPHLKLARYLLDKQIFVSNFAYPTPNDPPITRIVLSASHLQYDIEMLAETILIANLD